MKRKLLVTVLKDVKCFSEIQWKNPVSVDIKIAEWQLK